MARKWLLDGKVALKDGNFPAVEEKSHMVLRLADGWQPPGWTEIKGLGRVKVGYGMKMGWGLGIFTLWENCISEVADFQPENLSNRSSCSFARQMFFWF